MTIRIAINGFGRIGRSIVRAIFEQQLQDEVQVVAINELAEARGIAHLLKYDSSHGRFGTAVTLNGEVLVVGTQHIQLLHQADPALLPWKALNVDLVLECTGVFK